MSRVREHNERDCSEFYLQPGWEEGGWCVMCGFNVPAEPQDGMTEEELKKLIAVLVLKQGGRVEFTLNDVLTAEGYEVDVFREDGPLAGTRLKAIARQKDLAREVVEG